MLQASSHVRETLDLLQEIIGELAAEHRHLCELHRPEVSEMGRIAAALRFTGFHHAVRLALVVPVRGPRERDAPQRGDRIAAENHIAELAPHTGPPALRHIEHSVEGPLVIGHPAPDLLGLMRIAASVPVDVDLLQRDQVGPGERRDDPVHIDFSVSAGTELRVVGDDVHGSEILLSRVETDN